MREKVGAVVWVVAVALFVAFCLTLDWQFGVAAVGLMVVAAVAKWPLRGRRGDEEVPEVGWDYWTSPDPRKGEYWPAGYWIAQLALWSALFGILWLRQADESQPLAFPGLLVVFAGFGLYRNRTEGYRPPRARLDEDAAGEP